MAQENMGVDREKLSKAISRIGWDIINHVICPRCDLDENSVFMAAIYCVSIDDYALGASTDAEDQKKVVREIMARIEERYGLRKDELYCFIGCTPVALLACYILENGNSDAINAVIKE